MEVEAFDVLYREVSIVRKREKKGKTYVFRSPEGKVNKPQGIAKDVAFAVASLLRDAVHFTQDIWMVEILEVLGTLDVWPERLNDVGVVHQDPCSMISIYS